MDDALAWTPEAKGSGIDNAVTEPRWRPIPPRSLPSQPRFHRACASSRGHAPCSESESNSVITTFLSAPFSLAPPPLLAPTAPLLLSPLIHYPARVRAFIFGFPAPREKPNFLHRRGRAHAPVLTRRFTLLPPSFPRYWVTSSFGKFYTMGGGWKCGGMLRDLGTWWCGGKLVNVFRLVCCVLFVMGDSWNGFTRWMRWVDIWG